MTLFWNIIKVLKWVGLGYVTIALFYNAGRSPYMMGASILISTFFMYRVWSEQNA